MWKFHIVYYQNSDRLFCSGFNVVAKNFPAALKAFEAVHPDLEIIAIIKQDPV